MSKFWNPRLGLGDFDLSPKVATFTPEDGSAPLIMRWTESRTGQGNTKEPRRKADRAEWERWITITTTEGESFTFRRGGKPS